MTARAVPQLHGRWAAQPGGFDAYVPAPLPPPLVPTPALLRAQADADWLLGRLAGEARRLPNPHLLLRPFVRREAVLSSRIEGTVTSLGELLADEAGAAVDRDPDDLAEVENHIAALDLGLERLEREPIGIRLILDLHGRLMRGVRGGDKAPGRFRDRQNWIGAPGARIHEASFVPPPPADVEACMRDWERFVFDRSWSPLVQVAMLHYQFEAIHPFRDGNGRVGRLVIILFLVARGLLPAPLLYLSAFFEATRPDYYRRLRRVSTHGEWEEWLVYFLNGVARQSEDAVSRAERINALLAAWQRRVATSGTRSEAPVRLVDLLAGNPYCMVTGVAAALKVAFTTAQRAVDLLVRLGVLHQVNEAERDRLYCAREILTILEEPAHLVPEAS